MTSPVASGFTLSPNVGDTSADKLHKLIIDVSRESGKDTHIAYIPEEKKFSLDPAKTEVFWSTLCKIVKESSSEKHQETAHDTLSLYEIDNDSFGPLVVELCLLFSHCVDEPYTDSFIDQIVYCFQQAMKQHLDLKSNNEVQKELLCVSLETDIYSTNSGIGGKNSIVSSIVTPRDDRKDSHKGVKIILHFPYARIDRDAYAKYIRPAAITLLQKNKVLDDCSQTPVNNWDDIINDNSMKGPFLMYGAVDVKGDCKPAYFKFLYEEVPGEILEEDEYDTSGWRYKELSTDFIKPQDHSLVNKELIDPDVFEPQGNAAELSHEELLYWLPLMLSQHFYEVPTLVRRQNLSNKQAKSFSVRDRDRLIDRYSEGNVSSLETAGYLLDIMKINDRINNHSSWIAIGRALIGCALDDGESSEKGIAAWSNLTRKYSNRTVNECRYFASKFPINHYYTIKTLAWFAREDNRAKYDEWHRIWFDGATRKAISGLHTDVARAIHRYYWLEYLCVNKVWYEFRGNCWVEIGDGVQLRTRISDDFVRRCENIRLAIHNKQKDCNDDKARDEHERYIEGFTKLIAKLKNVSYKSALLKELIEFFHHERAVDLFDSDPNTLALKDGVIECIDETEMSEDWVKKNYLSSNFDDNSNDGSFYRVPSFKPELEQGIDYKHSNVGDNKDEKLKPIVQPKKKYRAIFRNGRPEDFISRCSQVEFKQNGRNYSKDHPLVRELCDWLNKVFPDFELREYFLKFCSSLLKGRNSDKLFVVFTGREGNNSKSMLVKLILAALGSYGIKFPTALFTGKRPQSSGPSPEIARAKCCRVAIAQEPGPNEQLQGGPIKEYTGGDSFYARMLHQNGGDITPLFKIIFMCNSVPSVANPDRAVATRMKLFPFFSRWIPDAPASISEQWRTRTFQMDPFFEERIPALAGPFVWLLTQYFTLYGEEGLGITPKIVDEYTKKYWSDKDPYLNFIKECIIEAYVPGTQMQDDQKFITMTNMYASFKRWWRYNFPNEKVPDLIAVKDELQDSRRLGVIKPGARGWHGIQLVEQAEGQQVPNGSGNSNQNQKMLNQQGKYPGVTKQQDTASILMGNPSTK
jgi:hypothetical protein